MAIVQAYMNDEWVFEKSSLIRRDLVGQVNIDWFLYKYRHLVKMPLVESRNYD